jgi:hypothetical protein
MGVTPKMNWSAKGGARSSLHYEGEGVLIHPPHQGVCGWHGTEEQMAWETVKANRGSGGVEGQSLAGFAAQLDQQVTVQLGLFGQ